VLFLQAPKAMQVLVTGFDDVAAVLSLSEKYRQRQHDQP